MNEETSATTGVSSRSSWKTVQRSPKKFWPFSLRMTFYFALISAMTAVILVIVLALVWEGQFQSYTRENIQRLANSTAEDVSERFADVGMWTREVLEEARGVSDVSDDVRIQVVSATGEVLYDDAMDEGWFGPSAEADEAELAPTSSSAVVSAPIVDANGVEVGQVIMWAFGTDALLTGADQAFRTSSYTAIVAAALVAVALACVFGIFVSRALSKPVNKVTSAAKQIRNGDLSARTGLVGDDEIGRLGETFDDMANTVERDFRHERRLTSDVAHELRTPLMAMLVTVEAMQDGVLPTSDENLATVADETRRLSRLVDAMLHLSRIENGTTELRFESTDIVALVRNLVSGQHQLFYEQGLDLRFTNDTGRSECYAEVDPDLIREALVNLLSNAMRYTNEGGKVVVTVAADRDDVLVSVKDTGIGMSADEIPRAFSRFWRSDVSRERESGGLGVGLAITKEIVDRHNGTITVDSAVGQGTTFTIRVPQKQERRK